MYRKAIENLKSWKTSKNRKPLIIQGTRQVGKTWLMKTFGSEHYLQMAYVNFDNNERMKSLFSNDFDIHRLMKGIELETDTKINPENTLLVFDEIQEVPRALTSLKYFYEEAPEYHILCAGSLLGVTLHPGASFPVGKVDFLNLYPLNFIEFLQATGNQKFVDLLNSRDYPLIHNFKSTFVDLLKHYLFVGGMPEVVSNYLNNTNLQKVRSLQEKLLTTFEMDFSKHTPSEIIPRMFMLWKSIPSQLAKDNKKFIYGVIRSGARAKEYELALSWLHDYGLIHKLPRIEKPAIPISSYQDLTAFKIYLVDVGLLGALSKVDAKSLLEGNQYFTEFKGSLTEQYVLQELWSSNFIDPYYWTASNGTAEIDVVFQWKNLVFPLEIKASENLQAKSLKSYYKKYNPTIALRTSLTDFRKEEWLMNIPLYMLSQLPEVLDE
ncbi:MAG: ATP-binding protein [Caldisericia bacterium]|nr:ATP-binding protein [Caldisericia bacterium]